jgi:seryl-tRNA synthetase
MCVQPARHSDLAMPAIEGYAAFRDALLASGLLVATGVRGLYGRSGIFERVCEGFDALATREARSLGYEVLRFPPLIHRGDYAKIDHIRNFPDLMGSVHTFVGSEREHMAMLEKFEAGEDWTRSLRPAEVMMTPAICYPLYPTVAGTLPKGGRGVDLCGFAFRHEPSEDPARMQVFRQREFVRLGTPAQAIAHRDEWLERGEAMLERVGLEPRRVVANDPFFGRAGKLMMATQREQELKYELVTPIVPGEMPTAVASSNYHLDHFGLAFGIRSADGAVAHSACIGFGLERIALALFAKHGFDPKDWPREARDVLALD